MPSSELSGLQNSLTSVSGSMASMNSTLATLVPNVQELVQILTDIKIMLLHCHNMHLHGYPHRSEDGFPSQDGMALLPTPTTPAEKLIQEYHTGYDIDYNGIIYGKDFKLIDDDSIPRMLKEVNKLLDDNKYSKMTFDQYLTSIPNYAKVWHV